MMTWATIHYQTYSTMAVEFGYAERQKDAIKTMTGAEWDKSAQRWLVPVSRLGDVVKLFWPHVTIDYAVLRARDEQLQRMFRDYMALGVRFDVSNGKVVCDHAVLNEWFAANSTMLHVNALAVTEASNCAARSHTTKNGTTPYGGLPGKPGKEGLWLRGVKNAQKNEDRKAAMLRRKREKIGYHD